jgi:hypothetical protein
MTTIARLSKEGIKSTTHVVLLHGLGGGAVSWHSKVHGTSRSASLAKICAAGKRMVAPWPREWAELDAGNGLVLGLHPARPPDTAAPGAAGAINVELAVTTSLQEVVDDLKKRGVKFKGPIEKYENVHLGWLLDPDGNAIVLAQQVIHAA